jgi:hypothetical protein
MTNGTDTKNARRPQAKRASPEFNKLRAGFMRRASAPNINPFALKLAYVIAFKYLNRESRVAFVGQDTLARDLNVTPRTIRTLLDILEPLGLTIIPGHGPNRASTYWIDPDKATPVSPMKTEKRKAVSAYNRNPASASELNTGNPVHDNRKSDVANTGSQLPPYLTKRTKKKEPREESDSPPDDASLDSKKDSRGKKTKNQAKPKIEIAESFEIFWAVYPRRVAKEAAHKAFAAAIKRGAEPEALNAGARRYAGERAGQEPRYTKHPATWLNGGCWEDEAPPRAGGPPMIDGVTGEPVAVAPARRRGGPQTWEDVSEELLAEIGDGHVH